MDERIRRFITVHVLELVKLSESSSPKAAAIFRESDIISSSYSKKIGSGYDSSPVVSCYIELLRTRKGIKHLSDLYIMCSYFPSLEEFLFLCHTDIRIVYYIGEILDEMTVRFLNRLSMENSENGFETIKINLN